MLDLNSVYKFVVKIAKKAYKNARKIKQNLIENKELNDIVTSVDKVMEREIVDNLAKLFPTHSFYGEEYGQSNNASEYDWLIDPIDGTINFAAGIPLYGTSIALRKDKETIFGVIFDWENRDIYHAVKGQGAFKNQEKLQVSSRQNLNECIVSYCLTSHYEQKHIDAVLAVVKKLAAKVRGLRLIVCSTTELAWLASGKTDAMLNVKPSIGLSSCAGKLIVAEAGGKITNLQGNPQTDKDTMLISNGKIHNEILKAIL